MVPLPQLDEVKQEHERLYKELQGELFSVAKPFGGDTSRRTTFVGKVDTLLKKIKDINERENVDAAQYHWLSSAVSEWQFALSSILGCSKDIPILEPPHGISQTIITESEIRGYLERCAYDISQARKQARLFRRLGDELHRLQTSSGSDMLNDWHYAQICFASDILRGKGELWKQIDGLGTQDSQKWKLFSIDTFSWLQRVWLGDVIQFRAFIDWINSGAFKPSDEKMHYKAACREFLDRVQSNKSKFTNGESYNEILDYINFSFVVDKDQRVNLDNPVARKHVELKARRIHDRTRNANDKDNWYRAEKFVCKFYGSIMLAISGVQANKEEIREAFVLSEHPKFGCSITDCFEAMLLIYCIKDFDLPDVWASV